MYIIYISIILKINSYNFKKILTFLKILFLHNIKSLPIKLYFIKLLHFSYILYRYFKVFTFLMTALVIPSEIIFCKF